MWNFFFKGGQGGVYTRVNGEPGEYYGVKRRYIPQGLKRERGGIFGKIRLPLG